MIEYWNITGRMSPLEASMKGCWTRVAAPTDDELAALRADFDIPDFFFEDINDKDERARYDSEDDWQLIILRVPYMKESPSRTPLVTVPLGIIFNTRLGVLITLSHFKSPMIDDFIDYQRTRGNDIVDYVDFIFRIFFISSEYYLKYLRQINSQIEQAKEGLDNNIDNRSLISLSRLQDSLTFFITSLKGNNSLLAKLKFKLPVDDLDTELIEDVNIELSQAMETSQIYSAILDSTMNTYSSVINNNVNTIMKVLTSVSIILMLPTLIASFMGMNLINGMESWVWGFPAIFGLSLLVSVGGWWLFRKHNLM